MNLLLRLANTTKHKPVMLWIDHSLGGGTETYSYNQFKKLGHKYHIFRLQYRPHNKIYVLTNQKNKSPLQTSDLQQIYAQICNIQPTEIVVNNLVGYDNTLDILDAVKNIKENANHKITVSFRGHDFQCICPSYNLINSDGKYCNAKCNNQCEKCWAKKRLAPDDTTHNILKSGATDIKLWRNKWGNFLTNVTDQIIVFSNDTANILLRAYPGIKNKISVIPHETQKYPHVRINPHIGINIAVFGNISHAKGASVINEMARLLPQCDDVKIIIIGTMANADEHIIVHGKYKTHALPKIMKQHRIDAVFIPSIWPETFSYTTSEAISMGLPVVCYDIGAPAERVSKYAKGLVLDNISPYENLSQIIKFIYEQRSTK